MPIQATCADAGLASGHSPRLPASTPSTSPATKRARGAAAASRDPPAPVAGLRLAGLEEKGGLGLGGHGVEEAGQGSRVPRACVAHAQRAPIGERHLDLTSQPGHGVTSPSVDERPAPARAALRRARAGDGRRVLRVPLLLEPQLAALLDRGLGRGEARDRDAERRAAHVVQADAVAELRRSPGRRRARRRCRA